MFSQALLQAIDVNRQQIGTMIVFVFSRANESFVVEELTRIRNGSQGSYKVRFVDSWYECGYFQALHYPCCHVLATCAYVWLDWGTFIDDVYRMQTVFNVYRMEFSAIENEDYWLEYSGSQIRPNSKLRRAIEGRPVSTRICNEMDAVEPRSSKWGGLCRQEGHSR